MYRNIFRQLQAWNEKPHRTPLIMMGVRQVGKTALLKKFAETFYPDNAVIINLAKMTMLRKRFNAHDITPKSILEEIQFTLNRRLEPGKTLLILDEIQECPNILELVDYCRDELPALALIAAGSMLGLSASLQGDGKTQFSGGQGSFMRLRPFCFSEFLRAAGRDMYADAMEAGDIKALVEHIRELNELLRTYFVVGGMPFPITVYVETHDFRAVREAQEEILSLYETDFVRYAAPNMLPKIRQIWESIPAQLSRSNRKFQYRTVKQGARAREYEAALSWLNGSGRIRPLFRAVSAKLPLKAYRDLSDFKIYTNDVGMLGAGSGLDPNVLLHGNDLFNDYRGLIIEQFAMQELVAHNIQPCYWAPPTGHSEVEFLVPSEQGVVPIEVKDMVSTQAKSLKVFCEKAKPPFAIRVTPATYTETSKLKTVPLACLSAALKRYGLLG